MVTEVATEEEATSVAVWEEEGHFHLPEIQSWATVRRGEGRRTGITAGVASAPL